MFRELLEKLNFKSLPPQATREINYDIDRKWMMIEQDARAEYDDNNVMLELKIFFCQKNTPKY